MEEKREKNKDFIERRRKMKQFDQKQRKENKKRMAEGKFPGDNPSHQENGYEWYKPKPLQVVGKKDLIKESLQRQEIRESLIEEEKKMEMDIDEHPEE